MKVLLISFVMGLGLTLSSCYKQTVCTTYTNNDVDIKVEKQEADNI